ncbi:MAG TPA: molybdopterin cofactor-binding domain-containing protein [Stellaceae bacterium]|nr:molybdopterin cofactor-binding domain-containing protein [Stellaceae bacterium]
MCRAHCGEGEKDRRRDDGGGGRGPRLRRRQLCRSRNRGGAARFRQGRADAYVGHVLPKGIEPGLDETLFYDPTGMGAPSGVHIAYVEVDPDTGMVEILDYVAVDDSGTIINPLLATGQIHGGVVQGIGQALYEEVCYDRDSGQLLTGSLLDYAVPHADSLPNIRSQFQETPSPTNPLGVKGIGESGSIGAPPTIVHAVLDALAPFGIAHLDMPLTPQKIWAAIQSAGAEQNRHPREGGGPGPTV